VAIKERRYDVRTDISQGSKKRPRRRPISYATLAADDKKRKTREGDYITRYSPRRNKTASKRYIILTAICAAVFLISAFLLIRYFADYSSSQSVSNQIRDEYKRSAELTALPETEAPPAEETSAPEPTQTPEPEDDTKADYAAQYDYKPTPQCRPTIRTT
jgi:hypothetical protein